MCLIRFSNNISQVLPNYGENELFFAMKGAGSSFGITTEFLYRIYSVPETRPVVLFLFIRNIYDMRRIEKLTKEGRFQISVYRLNYFRELASGNDNFVSENYRF